MKEQFRAKIRKLRDECEQEGLFAEKDFCDKLLANGIPNPDDIICCEECGGEINPVKERVYCSECSSIDSTNTDD